MWMILFGMTMNVNLLTVATEIDYRSVGQRAGILTMSVDGNDFFEASPDQPVYVRVRLDKGSKFAQTLVNIESEVFNREPIDLAMRVESTDGSALLNAPVGTVRIVRWRKGESEMWLDVRHSSSNWLSVGGASWPPSINRQVAWTIGNSIEEDLAQNEALFQSGKANLAANMRQDEPVDTFIMVDTADSILQPTPPNDDQDFDTIGFDFQTRYVRTAEHASMIRPGDDTSSNFSGDTTLAFGLDNRERWLLPYQEQGFIHQIMAINATPYSRPMTTESFDGAGNSLGVSTATLSPGISQICCGGDPNDDSRRVSALRILEGAELNISSVYTNGLGQPSSLSAIAPRDEWRFALGKIRRVRAQLQVFNPNPADVVAEVLEFNDAGQQVSASTVGLPARRGAKLSLASPLAQRHLVVRCLDPVVAQVVQRATDVRQMGWIRHVPAVSPDVDPNEGFRDWIAHIPDPQSETVMTLTLFNPSQTPASIVFTPFEADGSPMPEIVVDIADGRTEHLRADSLFDVGAASAQVQSEHGILLWSYELTSDAPHQPLFGLADGELTRSSFDWSSDSGPLELAIVNTSDQVATVSIRVHDVYGNEYRQESWNMQPKAKRLLVEPGVVGQEHVLATLQTDQSMAVRAAQYSPIRNPHNTFSRTSIRSLRVPQYLIPDPNLFAILLREVDRYPTDGWMSRREVLSLTRLNIYQSDIQSLAGLEHFENLQRFYASDNQIEDFSALSNMPLLETVSFSDNPVVILPDFKNLQNLRSLWMRGTGVASLNVGGLSALVQLDLGGNPIDTYALGLPDQLETLNLRGCGLSDVSLDVNGLRSLDLSWNQAPILNATLPNLTSLSLSDCGYSMGPDVSQFAELEYLTLDNNQLTDVGFLSGLDRLRYVNVEGNQVTEIAPLLGLSALTGANVEFNFLQPDQCATIRTLEQADVTVRFWQQTGYLLNCPP